MATCDTFLVINKVRCTREIFFSSFFPNISIFYEHCFLWTFCRTSRFDITSSWVSTAFQYFEIKIVQSTLDNEKALQLGPSSLKNSRNTLRISENQQSLKTKDSSCDDFKIYQVFRTVGISSVLRRKKTQRLNWELTATVLKVYTCTPFEMVGTSIHCFTAYSKNNLLEESLNLLGIGYQNWTSDGPNIIAISILVYNSLVTNFKTKCNWIERGKWTKFNHK